MINSQQSRSPWKKKVANISRSIAIRCANLVPTDRGESVIAEAEQETSLEELFQAFEVMAGDERIDAIRQLREKAKGLEKGRTINCKLNFVLRKATISIESEKIRRSNIKFRVSDALHLGGTVLELGKSISCEASLVEDGLMLTQVTGMTVLVTIMKGRYKCKVSQVLIQVRKGACHLKVVTDNPLIERKLKTATQVVMEAVIGSVEVDENERLRVEALKKTHARELRETYTQISVLNPELYEVARKVPVLRTLVLRRGLQNTLRRIGNTKSLRNVLALYSIALLAVSFYVHIRTDLPQIIPITIALVALSLSILGVEKRWSPKSYLVIGMNLMAMAFLAAKLLLT